jgi:hypothetical protein
LIGDNWIRHWGANAREHELLAVGIGGNRVRLKDGVIYTYLSLSGQACAGQLLTELHAAGTGTISIRVSLFPGIPDHKAKAAAGHKVKETTEPLALAAEPAVYRHAFGLDPHETGYLYISAQGEAIISHVSGVFVGMDR